MTTPTTLTRGDRKPDAVITIGDDRSDADFSAVGVEDVWVTGEMDGQVIFRDHPSDFVVAADGKSAMVRRPWAPADTATAGRVYIWVEVEWPGEGAPPQTFPEDGALVLDIRRKAGDE